MISLFFAAIDQQSNLSAQLASLADLQNRGTLNQQRQELDQAIDQAIETGERIVLRDGDKGNSDLNDNSGRNN